MAKQIVDVVYVISENDKYKELYVEWCDDEDFSCGFGTVKKYKDWVHGKYSKIKVEEFGEDRDQYEGDE